MPEGGATALEIPSDRPSLYKSFKPFGVPAATAVRLVTPPPSHQRQLRPEIVNVYMPPPPPEQTFKQRHAHAYISREVTVHVALHGYPVEQRTEEEIAANCCRFGFLCEVDPACFGAPDLATVHVVLRVQQRRETPRQLRIVYSDDSTSVVAVEIVAVCHRAFSYDADGQYVPLFQQPPAAAA